MTPASLLSDLRRRGLSARAESGRLVLAPASLLTDDLRAAVRRHKAALLALLYEEADPFGWGGPPPPWVLWGGSDTPAINGAVP